MGAIQLCHCTKSLSKSLFSASPELSHQLIICSLVLYTNGLSFKPCSQGRSDLHKTHQHGALLNTETASELEMARAGKPRGLKPSLYREGKVVKEEQPPCTIVAA